MKILAIDTSSVVCSVAILEDDKVLGEYTINELNTHSIKLMPMLDELVKRLKFDLFEIDYFACSVGPGSFTGIRIGMATVKALAQVYDKKVIAVSSILGLAYGDSFSDGYICPFIDAKNKNVYYGLYLNKNGLCNEVISPRIGLVDEMINMLKLKTDKNILFVGDGIINYEEVLKSNFLKSKMSNMFYSNATNIARAAIYKAKNGEYVSYKEILPMYLKESSAKKGDKIG